MSRNNQGYIKGYFFRISFILLWIGVFFTADTGYTAEQTQDAKNPDEKAGQNHEGFRSNNYLIRSGDKLNIEVFREKDLTGVFAVDDTGSINYPLLGTIRVQGMTLDQLDQLLTERLGRDYVVKPDVQVSYGRSFNKSIVVLGQVKKPGNYDYTPDMTLVRLVSEGGGFTELADLGRVKIARTHRDGTKENIRVNVKRILDGKDEDVALESADLIVVPESLF